MTLQKEFLRLDEDKDGIIDKKELEQMTNANLNKMYDINWGKIIDECDQNGDGVIDFQEFIGAAINRKALNNANEVKIAFKILDTDKDGKISLHDFNELFCSYGGAKMDNDIWEELLKEADHNGDGVVSENEFTEAMCDIIRKSLSKKNSMSKGAKGKERHTTHPNSLPKLHN